MVPSRQRAGAVVCWSLARAHQQLRLRRFRSRRRDNASTFNERTARDASSDRPRAPGNEDDLPSQSHARKQQRAIRNGRVEMTV